MMVSNTKAESLIHFTLKCLVYKILKEEKHNVEVECVLSERDRVDIMDWTDELVYEIQTSRLGFTMQNKAKRYTCHVGVRDVIFIATKDFDINWSLNTIYKNLKKRLGL